MGGGNCPEIAKRAGEVPLNSASEASESEAGDSDPPMDVADSSVAKGKGFSLVQVAQDALPLVDGSDGQTQAPSDNLDHNDTRRIPPKLHTQNLGSSSEDYMATAPRRSLSDRALLKRQITHDSKGLQSTPIGKHDTTAALPTYKPPAPSQSRQPPRRRSMVASPLRTFDFPASERSAMTLPAMQTSPSSLSANSPEGKPTLPSIQEHIDPLIKSRIANDCDLRSNGSRRPIPLINGSVQSPNLSSISSRSSQLPSPQTHMNSHFHTSYLPDQQSPATTYSDTSSREFCRQNQGPDNMVSPRTIGQSQRFSDRPPLQHDDSTTISTKSPQSGGGYGTNASANSNHVNAETTRRTPPPPPGNMPAITGSFKCDHADCTAAPFNTQYLLNSHANVHSQNRPYYCPVKTCKRSESGRGFKRKNELIRHRLVHQSPGYSCPFCQDRDHKYPRPDNLQRHVRVNHSQENPNNPALLAVLSQRLEGVTRGRRRRAAGG